MLLSLSFHIVKNKEDSEECVDDSYIKVWNTIPPYKPKYLKSFVCKITRQLSIDRYRYNHRQSRSMDKEVPLSDLDYDIRSQTDVKEEVFARDLERLINDFVISLDVQSKVLFVNKYFLLKDSKEISRQFEISENLLNVKIFRLKKKLTQYLEREGYVLEKR